jgi:outer membrane protein assembly factor BamB
MTDEIELVDLRFPGRPGITKTFLALLVLTILIFACIPLIHYALDEVDRQYANLASIGCGLLGVIFLMVTIWKIPYLGKGTKWVLSGLPIALLLAGSLLFEFVGFTGEMMPVLRWRFAGRRFLPEAERIASDTTDGNAMNRFRFTQFLGNDRNGVIRDDAFSMRWDERMPEIVWHRPVGAGWGGFAVAQSLAVTLEQLDDEESVTAFRLLSGEIAWQHKMPGRHYHSLGGLGPRSTPTLVESENGWLVVALGATGNLVCLKLDDGSVVWEKSLLDDAGVTQVESETEVSWGRSASPLVFDGKVIVPLGGRYVQSETKRSLIAYSLKDGDELWRTGISQIAYASPMLMVLDDVQQIVSVNEGTVTGHSLKNGDQLWESIWPSKSNADACGSQPVQIDGQRLLLGKGYAQGSKLIEIKQLAEESRSKSVKTWRATDLWVNARILKTKFTSAIHYEGYLYALSDGVLECVEPDTGNRRWRGERFGHGQVLMVNGSLLVTSEDGRIAVVDPENGVTIAQQQVLDGITWNIPSVAGPYLLVRNGTEAACLKSSRN